MAGATAEPADAPARHRDPRPPAARLRLLDAGGARGRAGAPSARRSRRLRLTPVMFELGSRAHPPRELYRAYLEQSDVFVGIYGERYGWIAPDMAHLRAGGRVRAVGRQAPAALRPRAAPRPRAAAGRADRAACRPRAASSTTPYDDPERARPSGWPTTSPSC